MSDETRIMNEATQAMADREGKYLTFTLAGEEYGIGILKIKEIIGMMPITTVPQTPAFVKGVINLRGKVIPVMDLRLRFGMDAMDYTERTCIIEVEIEGKDTKKNRDELYKILNLLGVKESQIMLHERYHGMILKKQGKKHAYF